MLCLCLAGCEKIANDTYTLLHIHALPQATPQEPQRKLAWALLKLDLPVIEEALNANAQPYAVARVVDGLPTIACNKEISPYALLLEGYLHTVEGKEDFEDVRPALDKVSECIELLIKHNISVDQGVVTLGSCPSMREFIRSSYNRLYQEKLENQTLDQEGEYALMKWQNIRAVITTYQPE